MIIKFTEGYSIGDTVTFDANARGVTPRIKTGTIVKMGRSLSTRGIPAEDEYVVKLDNGHTVTIGDFEINAAEGVLECDTLDEDYDVNDNLEDLLDYIEQKYDSSVTSINSAKLPAVFNMVNFAPGTVNLDFGGGRYDNVAEYLKQYDVLNVVYDPFNRSKEHNKEVLDVIKQNGGADTVTCSNVLNVIEEPKNRLDVIKNCRRCLKSGGTAYFTVYEGSGSGEGKANDKRASYQTNMKTQDYVEDIESVFSNVQRKGKLIIAK